MDDLGARVGQQESSGPVGAFRLPRCQASLTYKRGLLITGDSGDRYVVGKIVQPVSHAKIPRAGTNLRQ